jgi:hypothetical protein
MTVVLAMVALTGLIALVPGCSQAAADSKRAKAEVVASFLVAGSNGDKAAASALVTDPNSPIVANISAGSTTTTKATWVWNGQAAVIDLGTSTLTVTASDTDPGNVTVTGTGGVTVVSIPVKLVGADWKVDAAALSGAFSGAAADAEKKSCFANQRTIEAAYAVAVANGEHPKTVADLVPTYLKAQPVCPTTKLAYTLLSAGTVAPCSVHGHY